MSTKDRSAKAKTKKHIKVSTKNKIIITVVIVLLALLCFAYIANETGLPAKVLPGAKIVHTVDGKEKTVKRISIVEMNYYYALTYNQYAQGRGYTRRGVQSGQRSDLQRYAVGECRQLGPDPVPAL